jgi:hypothetical protein
MAKHQISSTDEALRLLKDVKLQEIEVVKKIIESDDELVIEDVCLLAGVAKKLSGVCAELNQKALHAYFTGMKIPLFICQTDFGYFRYFYKCDYSPLGGRTTLLEQSFYTSQSCKKPGTFLTSRYDSIALVGFEIDQGPIAQILDVQESVSGELAVLIQNQIDVQRGELIFNYGKEVEKY